MAPPEKSVDKHQPSRYPNISTAKAVLLWGVQPSQANREKIRK